MGPALHVRWFGPHVSQRGEYGLPQLTWTPPTEFQLVQQQHATWGLPSRDLAIPIFCHCFSLVTSRHCCKSGAATCACWLFLVNAKYHVAIYLLLFVIHFLSSTFYDLLRYFLLLQFSNGVFGCLMCWWGPCVLEPYLNKVWDKMWSLRDFSFGHACPTNQTLILD